MEKGEKRRLVGLSEWVLDCSSTIISMAADAGSFLRFRKRFAQDQFGWRELRRGFCPCTSALEML